VLSFLLVGSISLAGQRGSAADDGDVSGLPSGWCGGNGPCRTAVSWAADGRLGDRGIGVALGDDGRTRGETSSPALGLFWNRVPGQPRVDAF